MISPAGLLTSCIQRFKRKRLTLKETINCTDICPSDPLMESPEAFMVENDEIVGVVATVSGGEIIPTSQGHFPSG